jgi:hypothetical protein
VESTWRQLHVTAAASSSPPSLRPVCCRLLDGHLKPDPSQTASAAVASPNCDYDDDDHQHDDGSITCGARGRSNCSPGSCECSNCTSGR